MTTPPDRLWASILGHTRLRTLPGGSGSDLVTLLSCGEVKLCLTHTASDKMMGDVNLCMYVCTSTSWYTCAHTHTHMNPWVHTNNHISVDIHGKQRNLVLLDSETKLKTDLTRTLTRMIMKSPFFRRLVLRVKAIEEISYATLQDVLPDCVFWGQIFFYCTDWFSGWDSVQFAILMQFVDFYCCLYMQHCCHYYC